MEAQQTLVVPRRSISLAVAVVATVVAAALAVTLVAGARLHLAAVPAAASVVVLHEQAPDAVERNQQLWSQRAAAGDLNQSPDAQERNAQLSQARTEAPADTHGH